MKKTFLIVQLIIALLFYTQVRAQNAPVHIGILPFTSPANNGNSITDLVQSCVANAFANKSRYVLLDRDQTDAALKELEKAKESSSVYAKPVVEQGHQAIAAYLISGVVEPLEMGQTEVTTNYLTQAKTTMYHGTIHLSLKITRVEDNRIIYDEPIIVKSADYVAGSSSDIPDNAICRLNGQLKNIVRTYFPVNMVIYQVEKEKKGLPDVVSVNAGDDIFDNGKKNACSSEVTLANLFKKKIVLEVYTDKVETVMGQPIHTVKPVAVLKVLTVDGETSTCTVVSGANEIKAELDNKIFPLVRIQKEH